MQLLTWTLAKELRTRGLVKELELHVDLSYLCLFCYKSKQRIEVETGGKGSENLRLPQALFMYSPPFLCWKLLIYM